MKMPSSIKMPYPACINQHGIIKKPPLPIEIIFPILFKRTWIKMILPLSKLCTLAVRVPQCTQRELLNSLSCKCCMCGDSHVICRMCVKNSNFHRTLLPLWSVHVCAVLSGCHWPLRTWYRDKSVRTGTNTTRTHTDIHEFHYNKPKFITNKEGCIMNTFTNEQELTRYHEINEIVGIPYEQAEPWWRASIWRSHRKVVIKQFSYHNNIIDIKNRLPYSKVVYPAIIVLFSCLMEVNQGVWTGPDYPFR